VRLRVVGSGWIVNDYSVSFVHEEGGGSLQQSSGPRLSRIPSVLRLHLGYRKLGFLSVSSASLHIALIRERKRWRRTLVSNVSWDALPLSISSRPSVLGVIDSGLKVSNISSLLARYSPSLQRSGV
jgi:hypothetical protein